MEKLGDMIRDFTGDNRIKTRLTEANALLAWDSVVGEGILLNAFPTRIRAGILFVCVKSTSWAQELKGLEPTIIEQINRYLGTETVKEIRFFQGSIKRESSNSNKKADNKPDIDSIILSNEEKENVGDFIGGIEIEDEELKSVMSRILIKNTKLQKWRKTESNLANQSTDNKKS